MLHRARHWTVGTDVAWTDTGNASVTLLAGQSASYTFSAAPVGGTTFSSTVNFGCANLPGLASCSFNPATIGAGAGTTAVTVTVATMGRIWGRSCGDGRGPCCVRGTAKGSRPYVISLFFSLRDLSLGISFRDGGNWGEETRASRVSTMGFGLGLGMLSLTSCGVAGSGSTTPLTATVTVNPGLATLFANEAGNSWPSGVNQQQFTATVNNASDQTVTWAVTGGNANGTVDGTGLYSAPAVVPNPATVTVTATSTSAALPGSTFVTVDAPTPVGTSQITMTATATGGTRAWGCGDSGCPVRRVYRPEGRRENFSLRRRPLCLRFFFWTFFLRHDTTARGAIGSSSSGCRALHGWTLGGCPYVNL